MKKSTLYYLTFLWLLLLFLFSFIEYSEITKAREYCKSIDGTYQFKIVHLCDGEPIYKYSFNGKKFWSFEIPDFKNMEINWSIIEQNNLNGGGGR